MRFGDPSDYDLWVIGLLWPSLRIEHKDKLLVLIQNAAMSGMPCP